MKKHFPLLLSSLLVLAVAGVAFAIGKFLSQKPFYDPEEIIVVANGVDEVPGGGFTKKLSFKPPAENNFYCPGVTFTRDDNKVHFKYVRCGKAKRRLSICRRCRTRAAHCPSRSRFFPILPEFTRLS